jgi:hypothetical protein
VFLFERRRGKTKKTLTRPLPPPPTPLPTKKHIRKRSMPLAVSDLALVVARALLLLSQLEQKK